MRKLSSGRVIRRAAEERKQHFIGSEADPDVEPQVAIVRYEHVGPALESEGGTGLNRFMALPRRRKRNLALPVELESSALEGAVSEHNPEQCDELVVGKAMPFERRIDFRCHGLRVFQLPVTLRLRGGRGSKAQGVSRGPPENGTAMSRIVTALLLAVICCASARAAGDYSPAGISLDQLYAKTRGAGGRLTAGAYHSQSRETSTAGDVWTIDSYWDGSDYRTTVTQGSFVTGYGSYRGQEWYEDENGLVVASSDVASDHDPFVIAFSGPGVPSGVTLLGMSADPASFVVEATPRSGLAVRRFYDASTYLLDRIEESDYDGHKRSWAYGDYTSIEGRSISRSVTYAIDGKVQTTTALLKFERVAPSAAQLAMPASRTLFDLGSRDSVEIPAQFTDDGVIVRVGINGRGLDFVLDSGASNIVLDPQVARELGMSSSGAMTVSFAGDYTIADSRAPDMTIGELRASNVAVSTANFQQQGEGRKAVGLLGDDFIASGILEVNFEKSRLILHRSLPAGLAAAGWSALPLRLDWEVPLVKAAFSGREGYFIADLGADDSMLYPHYFSDFHVAIPPGTQDQGEMITLGGKPFGIKHFTMNSLLLGDWLFGHVEVVVPSASYAQEREYDGLIGRNTLSLFNLIFDYKDRQLWFKPIDTGGK